MGLLIAGGHRRIAFLGTSSIYTTAQRVDGYRQALVEAGIEFDRALVHAAITEQADADRAVDAMLALTDPPTAVFSSNVSTSVALLSGLRQRRWSPATVAFSDFDAARIHNPTVTVVDNDPIELGRRGAELALERLGGYRGPPRLVHIDTPIVERESHLAGPR
jgi:LacI family transcriptional regulator